MKLTSAKTVRRLKNKKITKPKSFSTEDIFKFYCNNKIKNNSAYYTNRGVLYLNVDKQIELLEEELEVERQKYIGLMDELDSKPYDLYLQRDIALLQSLIKNLNNKIIEFDTIPQKNMHIISMADFKRIIYTHNKEAQNKIIEGRRLNLKNGLGFIEARVVERNFRRKVIDQNETKKRKKALLESGHTEEELYHRTKNPTGTIKYTVFMTDDDWCRIAWDKLGKVKNVSVYEFKPTDNRKDLNGFKNRFSKAIKQNPLLKLGYRRYTQTLT